MDNSQYWVKNSNQRNQLRLLHTTRVHGDVGKLKQSARALGFLDGKNSLVGRWDFGAVDLNQRVPRYDIEY
jgi:hypothetical protein